MEVNDYKENYGSGWIKLHRSIKNHWLFNNDKFFKWWVILLIEVNHKDNKIQLGYNLHEIKRGQSAKSLRSWAKLFNSEVKQVVKFFDLLESDNMIKREILGKGKQSTTLINIENYSTYQGSSETQETTQRTTREPRNEPRERGTNNNDNKEKNEKEIFIKEEIWLKFQSWIKDNQLNKDKVYAQFDKAWFYYEDLNWKNKNGKEVINPVSTIRNNWFKELDEYKLSRREINDLRPPLKTIFTDGR